MDALDEGNAIHTDNENNDGGEENVEADEREGNREYTDARNADSFENEADDENEYRTNQAQAIQNEERMKRLAITNENNNHENYDSRVSSDYYQNQNFQPMGADYYENQGYMDHQTPQRNYEESYQTEDYLNNHNNMTEGQDDGQNNMLISQYESVLQSVNREFQKLLNKNKDTEEELSILKIKFEQIQAAYENEVDRNLHNQGNLF
jgi:hypothetical protein